MQGGHLCALLSLVLLVLMVLLVLLLVLLVLLLLLLLVMLLLLLAQERLLHFALHAALWPRAIIPAQSFLLLQRQQLL